MNTFRICTLGAVALLMMACGASTPRPTAQLTDATAALRAAEEVGAPDEPRAALYLKMSKDGIANGETLMDNDENDKAKRVFERAKADAELALVLTRTAAKQTQAKDAIRRVESLEDR